MASKRQHPRFLIKLPVDVISGGLTISGTTVRVSRSGLFVRSQTSFVSGTRVDMALHISEDVSCMISGVVKYTRNITEFRRQNGMGIEFTGFDAGFLEFIKTVEAEKA